MHAKGTICSATNHATYYAAGHASRLAIYRTVRAHGVRLERYPVFGVDRLHRRVKELTAWKRFGK